MRASIATLLAQKRTAEAAELQRILALYPQLVAQEVARGQQMQAEIEHQQKMQEVMNLYLDASRSLKDEIGSIFSGTGSIANLKNIFTQLRGKVLAEQIFGGMFDDLDKWIRKNSGIDESVEKLMSANTRVADSATNLADSLDGAAARIANAGAGVIPGLTGGVGSVPAGDGFLAAFDATFANSTKAANATPTPGLPANDNLPGDIVVTARKQAPGTLINPDMFAHQVATELSTAMTRALDGVFGTTFFGKMSGVLGGAVQGYLTAGPAGGIIGALREIPGLPKGIASALGKVGGGLQTGAVVAGIANAFGVHLSNTGAQIGGALGSVIPGVGSLVGSLVGGIVGSLFHSAKTGSAAIGVNPYGQAGVLGTGGNNAAATASANGMGGQVAATINQIAQQLGGTVGNFNVAIGQRNDSYRVSASGNQGNTTSKHTGSDIIYNGKDGAAAVSAAIQNAIQDGAIQGISAASQKILQSGQDLNVAIQKATAIENVPRQLKAMTDPVGAAVDDLNRQFTTLVSYLKEGGATTEQYAQAQKLYEMQRAAAIKQAVDQVAGSLKSLYNDLTVGNDTRSLAERKAAALAAYQPLADRVAAGDATAFNDYATAAKALLDIERQMSGSQADFFALQDQVTALTKSTLDKQDALATAAASGSDSPFAGINTTPTDVTVDQATKDLLAAMGFSLNAANDNLGTIIAVLKARGMATGVGGTSYF